LQDITGTIFYRRPGPEEGLHLPPGRVTERTIDKKGEWILVPEIELEGWWTSLRLPDEEVIELCRF
jgi:hypothetical protein